METSSYALQFHEPSSGSKAEHIQKDNKTETDKILFMFAHFLHKLFCKIALHWIDLRRFCASKAIAIILQIIIFLSWFLLARRRLTKDDDYKIKMDEEKGKR